MISKEVKVLFEPSGRVVHALPGTIILEVAARAGFIIHTPCGGSGKCGKCVIRIRHGKCPPSPAEISALGEIRASEGFRLACLAQVTGPITVEIPATSLFQAQQQILTTDTGGLMDVTPRVIKKYIQLQPPGQLDQGSDLDHLRTVIGVCPVSISALQSLPNALRSSGYRVTTVQVDETGIAIESGDTTAACFGLAFDIGSTTLVGTLVNLNTGEDMAVEARVNPQTSFGDDVVARIQKCRTDPSGLAQLRASVMEGVNKIIDDLTLKARISPNNIYEVVFAGNTTMQEILCGIDPSALGEIPFMPAFCEALEGEAAHLQLKIHPHAKFYIFPQIGGFVGGDTTAGILATRLDQALAPTLLVDIGTNGEIVLAHHGQLLATSVAAGPAFEGARIINGMRATNGAIEKVIFDGDVRLNVIGNTKPSGICGSGLIDIAAEMLRVGILDFTGRILPPSETPETLPGALRARLVEDNGETHFLLATAHESATGAPLMLYQRDIRELQLANAAIRAGINILLKHAGLQPEQLETILLAGGFGNFIRRNHAKRIGMLPPIPCSKIRFVGNTASFGAKRALLSSHEKRTAATIIEKVRHVDLSLDPEFQSEFGNAMLMPEGEFDDRE